MWVEDYNNLKDFRLILDKNYKIDYKIKIDEGNIWFSIKKIIEKKANYIQNIYSRNIENIYAIVGKNGVGKSSVIDVMTNKKTSILIYKDKNKNLYFVKGYSKKIFFNGVQLGKNEFSFYVTSNGEVRENEKNEKLKNIKIKRKISKINEKNILEKYEELSKLQKNKKEYNGASLEIMFKFKELEENKLFKDVYFFNFFKNKKLVSKNSYMNYSEFKREFLEFLINFILNLKIKDDFIYYERPNRKEFDTEERLDDYFKLTIDSIYDKILEDELELLRKVEFSDLNIMNLIKKIKGDSFEIGGEDEAFVVFFKNNYFYYEIVVHFLEFLLSLEEIIEISPSSVLFDNKKIVFKLMNCSFLDDIIFYYKKITSFSEFCEFSEFAEITFGGMSDGEKIFVDILIEMNNHILYEKEQGTKQINFCFDEIENYLHPEWCRVIIFDLIKYLEREHECNFNLIFSTHSPFLLSDIFSKNIILLEKDSEGNCKEKNDKILSFGSNIHDILSNGFFMDSTLGKYSEEKILEVAKKMNDLSYMETKEEKLEIEYIINNIGENLIKNRLLSLYNNKMEKNKILVEMFEKLSFEEKEKMLTILLKIKEKEVEK